MRVFLLCSTLLIVGLHLDAQGRGAASGGAGGAGVPSATNAQNAPAGNAANGKKIFSAYGCYQCHGYEGQGGAGARLAPRPIAFTAFLKYVRRPLEQMPPYTSKVVSDQELADIYAFLTSVSAAPPANTLPILAR
jgi:mono/diheme cytochrome c family protein